MSMNNHIKYDLENASIQMKVGIMNALYDIASGERNEFSLGKYISGSLVEECLEEAKWKRCSDIDMTHRDCDFWVNYKVPNGKTVELHGSLFGGSEWRLRVVDGQE